MTRSKAELIADALTLLGVDRLAFAMHQSAFPAGTGDIGMGSPGSDAADRLLQFVAAQGFNVLQLGPDGQISAGNPSPYDGTVFSRNLCCVDLLRWENTEYGALLSADTVHAISAQAVAVAGTTRSHTAVAQHAVESALRHVQETLHTRPEHPLRAALQLFREKQQRWLEQDSLFEAITGRLGHEDPRRFDPAMHALFGPNLDSRGRRQSLRATLGPEWERRELGQLLAHRQAREVRQLAGGYGLRLFGDFQVGWSVRDRFLHHEAFNSRFVIGAPPSRTNPEGQPWAYPLLEPDQLDDPQSPARQLLALRLERAFEDHDGLRIDHPHGLVCPWVYDADMPESVEAVQQGFRAFESPNVADPDLQRWAIAEESDLDLRLARWAEGWVQHVDPERVARWSRLVDALLAVASTHGVATADIAAEVLSTCPAPLLSVLHRHGLGRFRVIQKSDVHNTSDVYRTDQARPEDWVMLGTHDTSPILTVAERWLAEGQAEARATYLAQRLEPDAAQRTAAARSYCDSAGALAQAHLADLFLCDARNVLIYYLDLFGEREPFNRPGLIDPANWSQRLSPRFEQLYTERVAAGSALHVPKALQVALQARGADPGLIRALGDLSPEPPPV